MVGTSTVVTEFNRRGEIKFRDFSCKIGENVGNRSVTAF